MWADSLPPEPQGGSPENTGVWVAYPFSSRSSRPGNRTGVSCVALQADSLLKLSQRGSSEKAVVSASKTLVSADREMQEVSVYLSSHFFEHLWLPCKSFVVVSLGSPLRKSDSQGHRQPCLKISLTLRKCQVKTRVTFSRTFLVSEEPQSSLFLRLFVCLF